MTSKTNEDKNSYFELLRFIFSFLVLMVHSHGLHPQDMNHYPFVGGYIAVEFFFMLSGLLMCKNLENKSYNSQEYFAKSAYKYTFKKFKSIYPFIILALLLQCLVIAVLNNISIIDFSKNLFKNIYEFLLLQSFGFYNTLYLPQLWFISALLVSTWILCCLYYYNRNFFKYIFITVCPLIIYGYIYFKYGQLDKWVFNEECHYIALLRGIAGLSLGCLSYYLSSWINNYKHQLLFSLTSVFSLIIIICLIYNNGHTTFDFSNIFLIFLMISFGNNIKNLKNKLINNLIFFLGKISLPLYICHWTIREIVPRLYPSSSYNQLLPKYIMYSYTYSIALFWIYIYIKKICEVKFRNEKIQCQ